jgi:zinc transport system substrate-binding protein
MKSAFRLVLCLFLMGTAFARGENLRVLATFAPIHCFTANVAGSAADVTMLAPADVGPHDFALSPGDLRKIAVADVIVLNGLGLEEWLEKALSTGSTGSGKSVVRIVASRGVKLIDDMEKLSAAEAHGHEHGDGRNPHIWLDPIRAIQMVENIRDGLAAADPKHAAEFRKNAAAYIERLRTLDAEIRTGTEPIRERRLISFHDSLPYFAARYGFEIVAVFEAFPGREPTPKYLKRLRETIIQKQVKALFSEPQYSPQMLRTISAETKVPIAVMDPLETGEPGPGLYETVMRSNLRSLVSALHGS